MKEMKAKMKNVRFLMISLLAVCVLFFSYITSSEAKTIRTKEVTVYGVDPWGDLEEIIRWELSTDQHPRETILIDSTTIKEVTMEAAYIVTYQDESEPDGVSEDENTVTVTLQDNFDTKQAVIQEMEAELKKQFEGIISIELDEFNATSIVCEVNYQYQEELIIGETLNLPITKKDGKYELSPISLYIERYKVSYLVEDGGEFYIPEDDYIFLIDQNYLAPIDRNNFIDTESDAYYNVNWKSSKKVGSVIGSLDDIEKNYNILGFLKKDRYIIGHMAYYKLSDIIENWSTENLELFDYDEKTKYLYYGMKPKAKDKNQKDEIYEFVQKATKGCTTTKQKIKAIHDAIVMKYNVYENWFYVESFSDYAMKENLYEAKKLMKDKEMSSSSFAALFQECLSRIWVPCNIVEGDDSYWNRVYLGSKIYHVDTAMDAIITHASKSKTPYQRFYLRSAYTFMGTHIWNGEDYTPEKFSKTWKKINRNKITTTTELRRAVSYASYLSRDGKKRTYTFKITGKKVNTYCEAYVYHYGYISNIKITYKKKILTVTFN